MSEVNLYRRFEENTIFKKTTNRKLPLTLLTGPLGSGKTTLVQHILENKENLRVCCAVNDFASVNVDEKTLSRQSENNSNDSVVALSNGCVCCSLMGDFRESISKIIKSDKNFDYVVVETSGVTDPWAIVAALDEKFGKLFKARLDLVVCVVDATLFLESDDNEMQLSSGTVSQIAAADLVVINKIDLLDNDVDDNTNNNNVDEPHQNHSKSRIEKFIKEINGNCRIRFVTFGNIPIHELLDVEVADVASSSSGVLSHEKNQSTKKFKPKVDGGSMRFEHSRSKVSQSEKIVEHRLGESLVAFSCDLRDAAFDLARFQDFVFNLPRDVVRGKGTVQFRCDSDCSYEFQLSGNGRHIDVELSKRAESGVQLAFIGRTSINVDQLTERLLACAEPAVSSSSSSSASCDTSAILDKLASDDRFRASITDDGGALLFRVTADHIGIEERELRAYHGVALDRVNKSLLQAINAVNATRLSTDRTAPCLVTPTRRNDEQLWLRFALNSADAKFDALWTIVESVTDRVLTRAFKGVSGCKCSY